MPKSKSRAKNALRDDQSDASDQQADMERELLRNREKERELIDLNRRQRDDLISLHENEIERRRQQHASDMDQLKSIHEREMRKLRKAHDENLARAKEEAVLAVKQNQDGERFRTNAAIKETEARISKERKALERKHKSQIKDQEVRFAKLQQQLESKTRELGLMQDQIALNIRNMKSEKAKVSKLKRDSGILMSTLLSSRQRVRHLEKESASLRQRNVEAQAAVRAFRDFPKQQQLDRERILHETDQFVRQKQSEFRRKLHDSEKKRREVEEQGLRALATIQKRREQELAESERKRKTEVENLTNLRERCAADNGRLTEELIQSERSLQKLAAELSASRENGVRLNSELSDLQGKHVSLQKDIGQTVERLTAAEQRAEAAAALAEEKGSKSKQYIHGLQSQMAEIKDLRNTLSAMESERKRQDNEIRQLKAALSTSAEATEAIRSDRDGERKRRAQLRANADKMVDRLTATQTALEKCSKEGADVKLALERLKQDYRRIRKVSRSMEQRNRKLEAASADREKALQALEQKRVALEAELKHSTNLYDASASRLAQCEKHNREILAVVATKDKELADFRKQAEKSIKLMKDRHSSRQAQIAHELERLQAVGQASEVLQAQHKKATAHAAKLQRQVAELANKNRQLTNVVNSFEAHRMKTQRLLKSHDAAVKERNDFEAAATKIKQQYEICKEKQSKQSKELKQARTEITRRQQALVSLTNAHTECREKLAGAKALAQQQRAAMEAIAGDSRSKHERWHQATLMSQQEQQKLRQQMEALSRSDADLRRRIDTALQENGSLHRRVQVLSAAHAASEAERNKLKVQAELFQAIRQQHGRLTQAFEECKKELATNVQQTQKLKAASIRVAQRLSVCQAREAQMTQGSEAEQKRCRSEVLDLAAQMREAQRALVALQQQHQACNARVGMLTSALRASSAAKRALDMERQLRQKLERALEACQKGRANEAAKLATVASERDRAVQAAQGNESRERMVEQSAQEYRARMVAAMEDAEQRYAANLAEQNRRLAESQRESQMLKEKLNKMTVEYQRQVQTGMRLRGELDGRQKQLAESSKPQAAMLHQDFMQRQMLAAGPEKKTVPAAAKLDQHAARRWRSEQQHVTDALDQAQQQHGSQNVPSSKLEPLIVAQHRLSEQKQQRINQLNQHIAREGQQAVMQYGNHPDSAEALKGIVDGHRSQLHSEHRDQRALLALSQRMYTEYQTARRREAAEKAMAVERRRRAALSATPQQLVKRMSSYQRALSDQQLDLRRDLRLQRQLGRNVDEAKLAARSLSNLQTYAQSVNHPALQRTMKSIDHVTARAAAVAADAARSEERRHMQLEEDQRVLGELVESLKQLTDETIRHRRDQTKVHEARLRYAAQSVPSVHAIAGQVPPRVDAQTVAQNGQHAADQKPAADSENSDNESDEQNAQDVAEPEPDLTADGTFESDEEDFQQSTRRRNTLNDDDLVTAVRKGIDTLVLVYGTASDASERSMTLQTLFKRLYSQLGSPLNRFVLQAVALTPVAAYDLFAAQNRDDSGPKRLNPECRWKAYECELAEKNLRKSGTFEALWLEIERARSRTARHRHQMQSAGGQVPQIVYILKPDRIGRELSSSRSEALGGGYIFVTDITITPDQLQQSVTSSLNQHWVQFLAPAMRMEPRLEFVVSQDSDDPDMNKALVNQVELLSASLLNHL